MTIKDVLLPLTSYPVPTTTRAIENAVALAGNLGAHVSSPSPVKRSTSSLLREPMF